LNLETFFYINNKKMMNTEEYQILNTLSNILKQSPRIERTGTGTKSLFSPPEMRFSLENNRFPLLTTRKLPLKHIFEELMWILRGETDVKILQNKKVRVWDANSSRDFLDNNGLQHLPEWDIGESYGFNMRHFGGVYTEVESGGFDQLSDVIHLLKTNPTSRRIIINLWNPNSWKNAALPPCLFCYQFYVTDGKYLSCKATQRSSDMSLAGGWNIATISLLTIMVAYVCNLQPKEIIWSVGDAHIYLNQIEGVQQQLTREPRPFPSFYIIKSPINDDITKFEYDHFRLDDYAPYPSIKLAMNI
jgi:thymidylate synthase